MGFAYEVRWSAEDGEFVATVGEFPSLSYLAGSREQALAGLQQVVDAVIEDLADEAERGYDPARLRPRRAR